MSNNLFNELNFNVRKEIFYEILENQDKGFGFRAHLKFNHLSELHIETLDFLISCHKKNLLGRVTLNFKTEAVGEIKPLVRNVEQIEKDKDGFIISNSY